MRYNGLGRFVPTRQLNPHYELQDVFPTTGVLDSFNSGASQNLTARSGWGIGNYWGEPTHQTDSAPTESRPVTINTWYANYWDTSFNDQEVWATVGTLGSNMNWALTTRSNLGASPSDYELLVLPSGSWQIDKYTAGAASTILSGTFPAAISSGDSFGMRSLGSVHSVWYKPSGGAWSKYGQIGDASYASGYIAKQSRYTTTVGGFTEFGGGTYVPPGVGTTYPVNASVNVTATPSIVKQMGAVRSVSVGATPSITKQVSQTRSVSVTGSPSLVKQVGLFRNITATATPTYTGNVRRALAATVSVAVTPSIVKMIGQTRSVSVTATPSLTKSVSVTRSVTATATSSMTKMIGLPRAINATVTPSSSKQVQTRRAVNVTATPSIAKQVGLTKSVSGTITPTITKVVGLQRSVSVTATPSYIQGGTTFSITHSVTVAVTPSIQKTIGFTRSHSVTATPSSQKQVATTKAVSVVATPAISKQVGVSRAVTATVTPTISKRIGLLRSVAANVAITFLNPQTVIVNAAVSVAVTLNTNVVKLAAGGGRLVRKINLRERFNIN